MPYSLVLNLVPISPIPPGYLQGKHVHALFLNLVSSVDRDLGTYLHDQQADKAFSLSPLQVKKGSYRNDFLQCEHRQPIPASAPCWWRISLLDDVLFGHLNQLWLNLNPEHPWHLESADLFITSILGTPQSTQPWANFSTYAELYENASDEARQIDFVLCTPAAFRQMHYDCALPTRDLVFNSLLRRWNQYSGMPFEEISLDSVFPSFFDIHTEIVKDARSKFIGCVGTISFRIFGDVEPQTIKQINTLADFAMYCGIGRKTPMGMGMLRRI
uniref:CRISPR-associated endoribonuclease Cas6 n=1 Tax=Desertifilum tharense IPPAS B-1220 TaxID=1781255 RepID=A0ACD5GXN1_9CYAN